MKKMLKLTVIGPLLIGILISSVFFYLANLDDAPGLAALGLMIGFLVGMVGISNAKIIKQGWLVPFIFVMLGAFVLLMTIVLLIDGEFNHEPRLSLIGFGTATILLGSAVIIRRRRLTIISQEKMSDMY